MLVSCLPLHRSSLLIFNNHNNCASEERLCEDRRRTGVGWWLLRPLSALVSAGTVRCAQRSILLLASVVRFLCFSVHVDDKIVQLQGMASVKVVLDRSALPTNHSYSNRQPRKRSSPNTGQEQGGTAGGSPPNGQQHNGRVVYHTNPAFVADNFPAGQQSLPLPSLSHPYIARTNGDN